tara:strand:- start:635 stop:991 length:357 start_codon:yes stop_codon:yes gene_type:complete
MEAKELMIGNWVKTEHGSIVLIAGGGINAIEQGLLKAEPIQLTEEWFVKFGAELKKIAGMDNEYNIELGEVEISWDKLTGVTVFILNTLESFCVSYIKYVHQLQNLYFALTNKELTIK